MERSIATIAGAKYTMNFNYAGAPFAANTRIIVSLDGMVIGSYANTSTNTGNSGLNWQNLNFSFDGDGKEHKLTIRIENGSTASGAMIDAIQFIETLPNSANVVYGIKGTPIQLPRVLAQRNINNPDGKLKVELIGLPKGVMLTDGAQMAQTLGSDATLDVTNWDLAKLTATLNNAGDIKVQIKATTTEANGTTASTAKTVTVKVLEGQSCATPAGVNPFVSFLNDTAVIQTSGMPAMAKLAVTALTVENKECSIEIPFHHAQRSRDRSDVYLDDWMESLTAVIGKAVKNEIERTLTMRDGK